MPQFNSKGQILAGIAGIQSSVNGFLMPVLGNAAWLDDLHVIGQSLDATQVISVPVAAPSTTTTMASHPANVVVAGGDKWASFYQPSTGESQVDGTMGQIGGAFVYAAGSDGTIAWKRVYQAGAGLTLTAPDGTFLDIPTAAPIDVQVLGPGQALWLESGGGLQSVGTTVPVTALTPWQTRVVTLGSVRWVIYGTHAGGLIAQTDGATEGYVIVPQGQNAYNIDAVVVNGAIMITWAVTAGEPWQDVRQLTLDLSQPMTQLAPTASPTVTIPIGIQAHPRKMWLAPYYSFSVRYGDVPIATWETYANAATIIGDDPDNMGPDLARVFAYNVPMIVDCGYGSQAQPYIGSVVAWLASGSDLPSLQTSVQQALALPEKPIIAYLDTPADWPATAPSWMSSKVWPAVQAYRAATETIAQFTTRLTALLKQVASYGSYMVLTPRWDDVDGTQPISFTTDCMPAYATFIQSFPLCGITHFSDKRGNGIAANSSLMEWAQIFSMANVARPNRFDYWTSTQSGPAATLANKLSQTTELEAFTAAEKTYLLSKL